MFAFKLTQIIGLVIWDDENPKSVTLSKALSSWPCQTSKEYTVVEGQLTKENLSEYTLFHTGVKSAVRHYINISNSLSIVHHENIIIDCGSNNLIKEPQSLHALQGISVSLNTITGENQEGIRDWNNGINTSLNAKEKRAKLSMNPMKSFPNSVSELGSKGKVSNSTSSTFCPFTNSVKLPPGTPTAPKLYQEFGSMMAPT